MNTLEERNTEVLRNDKSDVLITIFAGVAIGIGAVGTSVLIKKTVKKVKRYVLKRKMEKAVNCEVHKATMNGEMMNLANEMFYTLY
jgi:hypothetical protein